ncbi:flagellar hook-length control protein FliK [Stutzerimonas chloritidismutans]|uniref:flagellar hook-length control protein FliK n=1 Tax=Stutzerimonas chloritidismutans TaxID=203192 RepID=UPI003F18D59E
MAVSPDLLLNIKAPTAAPKAPTAAAKSNAQPSRDEASSFANVYAKERQAKPVERHEASAKPTRDKAVAEKPSQETAAASGSEKPAVDECGNELPATAEATAEDTESLDDAEGAVDPLLLLGLGGPAAETPADTAPTLPTGSEFLTGVLQAQPASAEGDMPATEDMLLGQRTPLEGQTGAPKGQLPTTLTGEPLQAQEQAELVAPLQMAEESTEDLAEPSLEEGFAELLEQLDSPKETRSAAAESAINRLNPLAQAVGQQPPQVQRAAPLVPGQPVQVQQSGWSEAVVDRVMWMSSQNLKSAEIQLDPAELGRMEVRIDMNKDQAQVTFLSPHAGVRDALEGQMQRLRDMFTQQGMTMDVNVSDQSLARGWQGQGQGGDESRGGRGMAGFGGGDEEDVVQGMTEIRSNRGGNDRGLVDYYA